MNERATIPITSLKHHPDNPRKDLGDLEELSASIRANGILQNLTVVREDVTSGYYLVVIGNRRFEAAKMAGLTELPCVISDMDHKTQVATMLQENMLRQDLTIYEQAKGIQMMMDLGFNKDEISEKTGFSRSTIERRLAVASLPDEETQEAVECGWDLIDLVEISKIEDPDKQKKLLTNTNPGQLKQAIEVAKHEQTRNRIKARLMPEIEKIAKKLKNDSDRWSNKYNQIHSMTVDLEDETAELRIPEEYKGKTLYYCVCWGSVEFFEPVKHEKHVKSEQEIALEKKQHDAKELNARMRENRIAFVASWKPSRMQEIHLKAKLWQYIFDNVSSYDNGGFRWPYHNWDSNHFRLLCGMPKEEGRDKDETIYAEMARRGIPMGRAILAWILCGGVKSDDRRGYASDQSGRYIKDEDMDRVYDILTDNGYQLTDEEQQWKDGTHVLYQEGKQNEA